MEHGIIIDIYNVINVKVKKHSSKCTTLGCATFNFLRARLKSIYTNILIDTDRDYRHSLVEHSQISWTVSD